MQKMNTGVNIVLPEDISILEQTCFNKKRQLIPVDHKWVRANCNQNQIALFCHKYGFYTLPTLQLIEFLKKEIEGLNALEIGAGDGYLGRALNIKSTDNKQMQNKYIKSMYQATGQPITKYGDNVEKLDAFAAVEKYKPDVVVGSWITTAYSIPNDTPYGNIDPITQDKYIGIKEEPILAKIKKYILLGHDKTHSSKPIMERKHRTIREEWVISRSPLDGSFLKIWDDLN